MNLDGACCFPPRCGSTFCLLRLQDCWGTFDKGTCLFLCSLGVRLHSHTWHERSLGMWMHKPSLGV